MSSIRFRGGRVWYNPCDNPIRVFRNGKWHTVQHGVHYYYDGAWQQISCGFTSTFIANTKTCEVVYNYTSTYIENTKQCQVVT